jgi:hypothetical protein
MKPARDTLRPTREAAMAKFFGYDDGSSRRWINLDYVIHVLADRGSKQTQVFVQQGGELKHVILTGDPAVKFVEAMGLLEATGAHVK